MEAVMADGSPTVRRRRLGLILRDLREQRGMTGEEVGAAVERSNSWLSRIEMGKSGLRARDLRDLLNLFEVTDVRLRAELEELARAGKERGWWNKYGDAVTGPLSTYIGFEVDASEILAYESAVIPGLLQTEEYARALFTSAYPPDSADMVARKIKIRMARQPLLAREPEPLKLWAIIDESVLHRRIGSPTIMQAQLKHLRDAALMPNITLQVAPFTAGAYPGLVRPFMVLRFPLAADPDLAYTENFDGGTFAEGDDAERYHEAFNHLRAAALSPFQSVEMVDRALADGHAQ
jgi:transcriptional regulator with XRE-family HTH domain